MAPERFEFDIALTAQEYRASTGEPGRMRFGWDPRHVGAAALAAAVSGLMALATGAAGAAGIAGAAAIGLIAFETGWWIRGPGVRRSRQRPRSDGAVDSFHLVVDATGIRTVHPTREWLTRWAGYETLDAGSGAIVVRGRATRPAIIPRRCIASPADAERLERFIRGRLAGAGHPLRNTIVS